MQNDITIRVATTADAERISGLINGLAAHFLAEPDDPGAAEAFFDTISPESIWTYLAEARYLYLVAEAGEELVGTVGIRDGTHLYHLFVAEPWHGRGIASQLWELAKSKTRSNGNPVRFTVNASLNAVPVYERFGFVAAGPEQLKDGLSYIPMVLDK